MSARTYLIGGAGSGGGQPDTGQKVTVGPLDTTGCTEIYLGIAFSTGWSVTDVVDSFSSNTYTALASHANDTGSTIMVCRNPVVGSGHTVFLKNPPSLQPGLSLMGFGGGSSSVVSTSAGDTAGAQLHTTSTGTLVPDAVNQLLIAHCGVHGAVTQVTVASMSVSSPFTMPPETRAPGILAPPLGRPNYASMMAYQLNPAMSTQNAIFTWTGDNTASATMARMYEIPNIPEIATRNGVIVYPSPVVSTLNGITLTSVQLLNGFRPNP